VNLSRLADVAVFGGLQTTDGAGNLTHERYDSIPEFNELLLQV